MRGVTLVIAHRGASARAPENTVTAFELAVRLGADGIELDVRRSADDELVIHHDAHLPDGRVIRTTPSAELPEHVPTLDAALDACAGAFVNIEIKNDPREPDHDPTDWVAARMVDLLERRVLGPRWLISSFRIETVDACRRLAPALRTAWLTLGLDAGTIATTLEHGHAIVHPSVVGLAEADLRMAHAAGLAVNTWTCDEPARIAELLAWGIDGICTNVPDVALATRATALAGI
jgi:glycerophosphoryl diester phosphodiesterase